MLTESVTPQIAPRNTNPQARKSTRPAQTRRECRLCHYAILPSGECSNFECTDYRRHARATTGGKIAGEFIEAELFHGRTWGAWVLDTERLCLVFNGKPMMRGSGQDQYKAFIGEYEVDLERISDSASALDWLYQIKGSIWGASGALKDLVNAIGDVFDPQSTLCSGACGSGRGGKVIKNPGEFLRKRIATVGKRGAA
jgi:hypothetical protein